MAVFQNWHTFWDMCTTTAKTIKEERLRWILPIVDKEVKLKDAAKVFPHGKRTLERWVAMYRNYGESGLEPKSTARKTQENETPIRIKEHIIELRKKTKKCALKLHWQMKKEGLIVPPRTKEGTLVKAVPTLHYSSLSSSSSQPANAAIIPACSRDHPSQLIRWSTASV